MACGLLALDRLLGMHFFTNGRGGNMMNYINLFWIWGHPEVYILILPAFGIFSEVVATFARKRLFGYVAGLRHRRHRHPVVHRLAAPLLHDGLGASVNAFFGITTMVIAVPTGVKIFNWLFTMYRGRIGFHPSMLWTVGFVVTFVIGGMTGVLLAPCRRPTSCCTTRLFLVAHFHNVIIGGVVFGLFAGYMYWFPKAFGFRDDEPWGAARSGSG